MSLRRCQGGGRVSGANPHPVRIRPITDVATLRACEALQAEVWGGGERDVVPYHQLLAAAKSGGAVLGAFTPAGDLVGFCYGFVGLRDGRPFLYSHMAAVREGHRGRDVGFALKVEQRRHALEMGLDRVVWTFDPLETANAYFNLHKLGAEATRYLVDYYGEMHDALNRGLPSDRLEVDWWIARPHVEMRLSGGHVMRPPFDRAPRLLAAEVRDWALHPGEVHLDRYDPVLLAEVPATMRETRQRDPGLARAWRDALRTALVDAFSRGYAARDYLRGDAKGAYVLERAEGGPA